VISLNAFLFPIFAIDNEEYYTNSYILNKFDIDDTFLKDKYLIKKINKYEKSKDNMIFNHLNKAYLLIPMLKHKIKSSGIPEEMLYLSMAESNFLVKAYSKARAAGLWQFMKGTGRHYGLRIDTYIDERNDILKSTDAAITYLKDLHGKFGKWYLAIMAYNCGEGRVRQAIRRAKSDKLEKLLKVHRWKRRQYLPSETRDYIRKIVALSITAKKIGFFTNDDNYHLLNRGVSMPIVPVKINSDIHISDVSKILNMPYSELRDLNKHLKYNITPPDNKMHKIYIPYSRLVFFNQNKDKLKKYKSSFRVYIVSKGDNLYDLGHAFGIPYKIIKMANGLTSNTLKLKQKLIIPTRSDSKLIYKPMKNIFYTVKRGDTLNKISKKFNIRISSLLKKNKRSNNIIKIGEKLSIR
jgi:membrane-bound lytic murein transglycosylase D